MALDSRYRVRPLGLDDLTPLAETMTRQQRENGRDGRYFSPYPADAPPVTEDAARFERWRTRLPLPLDACDWMRAFGLCADDALVGHVTLHGARLAPEMHRASVGIGIERAHHRRGGGRALMNAALDAARAAGLSWVDLGVFEANAPARALYASLGFVETGRTEDRFRVEGVSLGDVQMTLRL